MKNLGQVKNNKDIVTKQYTDDGLDKKANTDHIHDKANESMDGFMSADDKKKLNTIEKGATKVIVDTDFDENSTNALQNKKITNKFMQIDDNIDLINDSAIRQQLIPVDTIIDLNNTISDMKPPILQGINDLKYQMIRRYYYDKNIVGVTEIKNIPSILKRIGIASMNILLDNELIPRTSDYVIRQTLVSIIDSDNPRVFERSYYNKYSTPDSGVWNNWVEITSFNIINDTEQVYQDEQLVTVDKGLTIEKDYDNKTLLIKHTNSISAGTNDPGSTGVSMKPGEIFRLPWVNYDSTGHITASGSRVFYNFRYLLDDVALEYRTDQNNKIDYTKIYHKDFLTNDISTVGSTDNVFIETGTLFQLPYFKVNKQGHIIQTGSGWYRIDSDHKVKQEPTNSSDDSRILLSTSATDDEETATVKKSSKLTFNSYSGELKVPLVVANAFKGNGSNLIGIDKVKQEPVTNYNNSDYRVLFSNSATDDEETATVKKYKDVYYNPYEAHFKAPVFNASTGFIGKGTNITNINASNISSGTLEPDRLEDSGVTSGSYGPSDNGLGSDSHTLKVPYITIDTKGRVTNAVTQAIKLPKDSMVQQFLDNTSNKKYRLLLSNTDSNYSETTISRKSDNLTYNPSTNTLSVGNITTTGTITSRGLQCDGDLSVAGISASQIKATGKISGSGAGITNLNASNIKLGTLSKDIIIEGNAATATKATIATSLETARNINGISFDGSSNVINYGVCNSSESATEKVVACPGFTLINGAMITVYFSKNNTVARPTLNVNSTGAKNIINKGFTNVFENYLNSGRVFTFIYISGSYHIIGGEEFNLNSLVVAGSSTATTTTTTALANSQVHLNMIEDGKVKSSFQISGEGQTSVTADSTGNISVKTSIASLPNPNALTIQGNGKTITAYDGSYARTVNITPSSIGAAASHSHPYLPLAGGTISSSNFGPLTIERSGTTNGAAIYFKNSNGILGSIGMTNSVNSGLQRWGYGTDTHMYTVLDTGNAFTTTTPKANGTAAVGSATTVSRSDHVHPLQKTILQTPHANGTQYLLTTTNSSNTIASESSIGKSPLVYIDYSVDGALLCSRGLLSKRGNLIASGNMAVSSSDYSANITIDNINKYSVLAIYITATSSLGHRSNVNGTIPIQYLLNNTNESVKIGPIVSNSSTSDKTIMQIAGYISCSIDENSNALKLTAYDGNIVNGFTYYIYNLI